MKWETNGEKQMMEDTHQKGEEAKKKQHHQGDDQRQIDWETDELGDARYEVKEWKKSEQPDTTSQIGRHIEEDMQIETATQHQPEWDKAGNTYTEHVKKDMWRAGNHFPRPGEPGRETRKQIT